MPTDVVVMTTPNSGRLPEIDGVPCTGHNSNECLGLAEEDLAAGPAPTLPSSALLPGEVSPAPTAAPGDSGPRG